MEYIKSDHTMSGKISKKKFEDIDKDYVIQLLKAFLGKDNPNYELLSKSGLTQVKFSIEKNKKNVFYHKIIKLNYF